MVDTNIANKSTELSGKEYIPTVSIGMPVYNGENYIREALDSLLAQTFTDFELIISDNASTDSTESICRQYAKNDTRIRYLRQESNIGAAANFRFVLIQARGAYFMWAACDDRWSLDWLEKLHMAIGEADVGMFFGEVVHIDATGRLLEHPANRVNFRYGFSDSALKRRVRFYLAYEGMGKANSIHSLYARELIEPLRVMLTEMISGSRPYDYTIVYGCLQSKKIKQVGVATLFKRVHTASESSSREKRITSVADLTKRIVGILWPFPPKLIMGYLRHSTPTEQMILLFLLPAKLLVAYRFRLKQIISRLRLHIS